METAANYIALSIPVFFVLIGLELLFSWWQRKQLYRFADTLANISCGIAQQVLGAFIKTAIGFGYLFLYDHYRITTLDSGAVWVWVLAFISVDFFYYWFHRYAHEISLLWGGHIVHHQSEEYNLSVALRQGSFQNFTSWVFYLPLAFMGLPPTVFLVVMQFVTLYQFWIHTRLINKMPAWFEFVFNTPSHHRVHHGVNPEYIDKNHGGTFIVWDRLFGTFQSEQKEVVYGITKPLKSWNPVWANVDYYRDMFGLMARCKHPLDVVRVMWHGPGWRPEYLGGPLLAPPVDVSSFRRFETTVAWRVQVYVLLQYTLALAFTAAFLFQVGTVLRMIPGWEGWAWLGGFAVSILMAVAVVGGLTEGQNWAAPLETLRILATLALGWAFAVRIDSSAFWLSSIVAYGLGSAIGFGWIWASRGENTPYQG